MFDIFLRSHVVSRRLRRTGTTKGRDDQCHCDTRWRFIQSGRQSELVSRRIVRVANHVRLSFRKIDPNGSAVSRIENPDRRRSRASNGSRLGKMATRQSAGLLLRGSHASRSPEIVLVNLVGTSRCDVRRRSEPDWHCSAASLPSIPVMF